MHAANAEPSSLKIGFLGLGFSSLVNGATLAYRGHAVALGDPDPDRAATLLSGRFPYREPGLEGLVENVMAKRQLEILLTLEEICRDRDILFLTLEPTCSELELESLAHAMGPHLTDHTLLVLKSPVAPGLTERFLEWVSETLAEDATAGVAFAPDGFRPGTAVKQALYPERLLVGADHDIDAFPLFELYADLECPIVLTSTHSAEVARYVTQAILATQTSLLNGLTGLCEEFGADLHEVLEGIGFDPASEIRLGLGGGTVFKEASAFLEQMKRQGHELELLREAIIADRQHTVRFLSQIRNRFGDLSGLTVTVLGLAQSPYGTDERDSRPLFIVRSLLAEGALVRAFDPHVMSLARAQLSDPQLTYHRNAYEAADGADVVLILTDWPEFSHLDYERLSAKTSQPVLFDGRTLENVDSLRSSSFEIHSISHAKVKRPTPTMRRRTERSRAFTAQRH